MKSPPVLDPDQTWQKPTGSRSHDRFRCGNVRPSGTINLRPIAAKPIRLCETMEKVTFFYRVCVVMGL
jgi:hypothetical protein